MELLSRDMHSLQGQFAAVSAASARRGAPLSPAASTAPIALVESAELVVHTSPPVSEAISVMPATSTASISESALAKTLSVDTKTTISAILNTLMKNRVSWEGSNNGQSDLNANNWTIVRNAARCFKAVATLTEKEAWTTAVRDASEPSALVLLIELERRVISRFDAEETSLLGKPSNARKFTLNSFAQRLSDLKRADPTAPARLVAAPDGPKGSVMVPAPPLQIANIKLTAREAKASEKKKRKEAGLKAKERATDALVYRNGGTEIGSSPPRRTLECSLLASSLSASDSAASPSESASASSESKKRPASVSDKPSKAKKTKKTDAPSGIGAFFGPR